MTMWWVVTLGGGGVVGNRSGRASEQKKEKGQETSIKRTSGGSSFGRATWLPSGSLFPFRLSWRMYCAVGESSASPSSSSSPRSSIRETPAPPLKSCGVRRSRSPSNYGGGKDDRKVPTKSDQEATPLSVAGQEHLCRLSSIGKACLDGQVCALRGEKGVRNRRERREEGMIPNIMTATSTEHKTPSS